MDNEDSADPDSLIDDLVGWDFVNNDNNPFPDTSAGVYQHGTMMSSVCAVTNNDDSPGDTSIAGISWHCKIVPLRIAIQKHVIAAINYAINMEFDVLNMSVGWAGYIAGFPEVVQRADSCGIVQVAAVGQYLGLPLYPAAFPEVIGVVAVDESGNKLSSSGAGYYVDVCGLGANTKPREMAIATYGYYYRHFPGSLIPHVYYASPGQTSYASAQTSAVAGLLKSLYPEATPEFILQEIQRGAIPVDTAQGNVGQPWQYWLGAGRINPYRSMTR